MENFIEIYKKALPANICKYMIKMFEENMDLSHKGVVGIDGLNEDVKKSIDVDFLSIIERHPEAAKTIPYLKKAIDSGIIDYFKKHELISNMRDGETEDVLNEIYYHNVIYPGSIHTKKYLPNDGFFNWHFDQGSNDWFAYSRVLVAMFYLNDVKEGGQTEFLSQEVSIKPSQGDLVIWPATWTHKHRGKLPISSSKYICNFWLVSRNPAIDDILNSMETIEINGQDYKNNWITQR